MPLGPLHTLTTVLEKVNLNLIKEIQLKNEDK